MFKTLVFINILYILAETFEQLIMKNTEIFTVESIDSAKEVVNVLTSTREKKTFKITDVQFIGFNRLHCRIKNK